MGINKKGQVEDMVKMTIIVAVIVIVLVGLALIFYNYVYPSIGSIAFDKLPASVKKQVENNWDYLIGNISSCMNITDYDCLCEGFPNFPATFTKEYTIMLEQNNISLYFKKAQIKTSDVGAFRAGEVTIDSWNNPIINQADKTWGDTINFGGMPSRDNTIYPNFPYGKLSALRMPRPIITDKFYKPEKVTVNFLFLISSDFGAGPLESIESISKNQNFINQKPQCLDWRLSAINKFVEFVTCANLKQINSNCQFSVKNVDAFNVQIDGTSSAIASLFYNQQSVKKYDVTLKKSFNEITTVPATCNEGLMNLQNGDSVKIISENGKVCLKKL